MNTQTIHKTIEPYKQQLLNHPLYSEIKSLDDLYCFLENHVYAVWDFMSLLKALQNKLTCTTTPWLPVGNPEIRYLINEIVLAEETDLAQDGSRKSHYELYLDAMTTCGANTTTVLAFLKDVEATQNIFVSIKHSSLHENVKDFLDFTFRVIEEGNTHQIAAAFTFGREDLIPDMFTQILKNFQSNFPDADLSKLLYYFERHIELDGDEHGLMAMKMIEELCGTDEKKWQEASDMAILALEKRIKLWDAIGEQIALKQELV